MSTELTGIDQTKVEAFQETLLTEAGFTHTRLATHTPFNLIIEARP